MRFSPLSEGGNLGRSCGCALEIAEAQFMPTRWPPPARYFLRTMDNRNIVYWGADPVWGSESQTDFSPADLGFSIS